MNESAKTLSDSLTRQYSTRNPFRIARMLDITIKYINTKRQKGFCKIIDGYAFIFINQNLSEQMQRMTCAHELGHILLHKDLLEERQYLLEYELFDIQNQTEYEANVFAANLLIDEEELYESMWNLAGVVLILLVRDKKTRNGQVFALYLFWYSLGRLFLEGMRDSSYILWLIPDKLGISQAIAVIIMIVAVAIFVLSLKSDKECFKIKE